MLYFLYDIVNFSLITRNLFSFIMLNFLLYFYTNMTYIIYLNTAEYEKFKEKDFTVKLVDKIKMCIVSVSFY